MCCGLQMAAVWVGAGWRVFDGAGWRMLQPAQRRAYPWRIVMSRTTAHTVRRASVFEGIPAQNKSTWQKAKPFNDPNSHTPVINGLEAEAAKVKRTTGCTVARTFVPKKEVKSAKRQKDTEEETCQFYSFWRTVWQQQAGWEVGELHRIWQVGPRGFHKRGSVLEVYICHNCESNYCTWYCYHLVWYLEE